LEPLTTQDRKKEPKSGEDEQIKFLPDLRHYGLGAQILVDLGIKQIKLLTNNPRKIVGLDGFGLSVTERVPFTPSAKDKVISK
ncbi:MAG: hypothetical protein K8I00_00610, partial [Candidatus Omnitrophica bacterium]|nr:hypothetical protein [Candidatus Omnitrophota bacterium]